MTFIAEYDGTEQKYAIMVPESQPSDRIRDLLIGLHGHGSDRWQYIDDPRGECLAARDVAAEQEMIYVSPDYRITSWMGATAEADII